MDELINDLNLESTIKTFRKLLEESQDKLNSSKSLETELIKLITSNWTTSPDEVKKLLYPEDYYEGIIEATTKKSCIFPDRGYELRELLNKILSETKISRCSGIKVKGYFGFEEPLMKIGFIKFKHKIVDDFEEYQTFVSKNDSYFLIINVVEKWWRLYDYHTQYGLNNKYIGYTAFDDEGKSFEVKDNL